MNILSKETDSQDDWELARRLGAALKCVTVQPQHFSHPRKVKLCLLVEVNYLDFGGGGGGI